MSELNVVETDVDVFDRVALNPEGRIEYEDGRLTALYPEKAGETEYVVARFHYDSGSVELPDDTVVLGVDEGVVMALVPEDAYHTGGGA